MKSTLTTSILTFMFINGFSQNLQFDVRLHNTDTIKKEVLLNAKTIIDVSGNYPTSWISNYVSTQITAICNGKEIKAKGTNEILTPQQQEILKTADIGSDIFFNIHYKYKNTVTENMDDRAMYFTLTLAPETQAEYIGGSQQMKQYLKENAINKITDSTMTAILTFTVDENGDIADAKISQSSLDLNTDSILLEALKKMPKWKPAKVASGVAVKQNFVFSVGGGC